MSLSSLLDRFNEPETLKMAKLGRELRGKGIDVIDLSLGEPDFDTPQHIKDAAIKAINDNWSHYTPVAGFVDLREAVCSKLKRDNNLEYSCENIVTSTGAKQSLANVILALVDKDDEVIIPTPYWVTYSELVKIAGGKVVEIRSKVENCFKITPQQLEDAITQKEEKSASTLQAGEDFLAENAKRPEVTTTASGLQYEVLNEGTGPRPKATNTVTCHYHGTLINGTVFDSSVQRGQPASFPLNMVIKGWTEALQLMSVGSKYRLFLHPTLAYGERSAGAHIQANSTLIFDVELLGIK